MLKYPGISAPVVSRTASCGIFTSPDSMASIRLKSLTTHGKGLFVLVRLGQGSTASQIDRCSN